MSETKPTDVEQPKDSGLGSSHCYPMSRVVEGYGSPFTVDNPYDTPEYWDWVASMSKYCHCTKHSPCDGVLAGGICDGRVDDDEDRFDWDDRDDLDGDEYGG